MGFHESSLFIQNHAKILFNTRGRYFHAVSSNQCQFSRVCSLRHLESIQTSINRFCNDNIICLNANKILNCNHLCKFPYLSRCEIFFVFVFFFFLYVSYREKSTTPRNFQVPQKEIPRIAFDNLKRRVYTTSKKSKLSVSGMLIDSKDTAEGVNGSVNGYM